MWVGPGRREAAGIGGAGGEDASGAVGATNAASFSRVSGPGLGKGLGHNLKQAWRLGVAVNPRNHSFGGVGGQHAGEQLVQLSGARLGHPGPAPHQTPN